MFDLDLRPIGGVSIWLFVGLAVVGLVFAPTLGAALIWAIVALAVAFVFLVVTRRVWLRLVGRRGGR